jgi:hypothetical protein
MTAELRLALAGKEARLSLKLDDKEIEDELWTFDKKLTKAELKEIATCVFQDAYEVIQYAANG